MALGQLGRSLQPNPLYDCTDGLKSSFVKLSSEPTALPPIFFWNFFLPRNQGTLIFLRRITPTFPYQKLWRWEAMPGVPARCAAGAMPHRCHRMNTFPAQKQHFPIHRTARSYTGSKEGITRRSGVFLPAAFNNECKSTQAFIACVFPFKSLDSKAFSFLNHGS